MEKVKYALVDGIQFDRYLIGAKQMLVDAFGEDEEMLDAFEQLEQSNNEWIMNGFVEKSEMIRVLEIFKTYLMTKVSEEDDATELSNLFDKEIEKIFS